MRITVFLVLSLLLSACIAGISMKNANDKQLPALVSGKWYNLLSKKVVTERANLLKLLGPGSNSTGSAVHGMQLNQAHLLEGQQ